MELYSTDSKSKTNINVFRLIILICILLFLIACDTKKPDQTHLKNINVLNYLGSPDSISDRSMLVYSDQGAWFGYALPHPDQFAPGFCGPFLMTQENGVWMSPNLSRFQLFDKKGDLIIDYETAHIIEESHPGYLLQIIKSPDFEIEQKLIFISSSTAVIRSRVKNRSVLDQEFIASYLGKIFLNGMKFEQEDGLVIISSEKSEAVGMMKFPNPNLKMKVDDSTYIAQYSPMILEAGATAEFMVTHSFIFPNQDYMKELLLINEVSENSELIFNQHDKRKNEELEKLYADLRPEFDSPIYELLLAKSALTLQNNWRSAAGELRFAGCFPSYHYKRFHGFWAWDSWKHAVALVKFNPELAKSQILAMYDFMEPNGFIPDCVYRDTTIENHNYRNTKPPLSAWAIWKVFEETGDEDFLREIYSSLIKQHEWWYQYRDNDHDGICEYGSTDGSLIAAKWESGMDNAVRFDESKILENGEGSWSLDQESVDLNAYLYAEKKYIAQIAAALKMHFDQEKFEKAAIALKEKINSQFWDEDAGWYFDTSIDGSSFIEAMGPEGWIPLWAGLASPEQAAKVKDHLLDPEKFNTEVPFPTLAADHPEFTPYRGYWRGPVWLDQAYFGVKALQNYGYHEEAKQATLKLMHNANGVLEAGVSIRENYHPLNGQGLESRNFSWSAAHYILLLTDK